jgi:hypothetical protein
MWDIIALKQSKDGQSFQSTCLIDELYFSLHVNEDRANEESSSSDRPPQRQ